MNEYKLHFKNGRSCVLCAKKVEMSKGELSITDGLLVTGLDRLSKVMGIVSSKYVVGFEVLKEVV